MIISAIHILEVTGIWKEDDEGIDRKRGSAFMIANFLTILLLNGPYLDALRYLQ